MCGRAAMPAGWSLTYTGWIFSKYHVQGSSQAHLKIQMVLRWLSTPLNDGGLIGSPSFIRPRRKNPVAFSRGESSRNNQNGFSSYFPILFVFQCFPSLLHFVSTTML